MDLDEQIRALVVEVVRSELPRILDERAATPERLSTSEAARSANVHPKTVRRWIAEGKLPSERAGREIRVRRTDLEALLRRPRSSSGSGLTPEQMAKRDFG